MYLKERASICKNSSDISHKLDHISDQFSKALVFAITFEFGLTFWKCLQFIHGWIVVRLKLLINLALRFWPSLHLLNGFEMSLVSNQNQLFRPIDN